jgi:hypothetical protein
MKVGDHTIGKGASTMSSSRFGWFGGVIVAAMLVGGGCSAAGSADASLSSLGSELGTPCENDAACPIGQVCSTAGSCVNPAACGTSATGDGVVQGSFVVDGADTAGDLAPLAGAWCVSGDLTIRNSDLVTLSGLSSLIAVGGTLSIQDNASLVTLDGLQNLRRLLKLSLFRNPELSGLTALTQLKTLSSLQVYVNPKLSDLHGLDKVTGISWAEIVNNANLESLAGLDSLATVYGYLDIRQDPKLPSLEGLRALRSVGSLVQIADNAKLASLNGLDNLETIGSTLRLLRNPELRSLDALGKLTRAPTFQVTDNPALDGCSVTALAGKLAANCSACVRNGPCAPSLAIAISDLGDAYYRNETPNRQFEPGEKLTFSLGVRNDSASDVHLSPARVVVDDPFVSRVESFPFPLDTARANWPYNNAYPSLWIANDAPDGHVIDARVEVDWTLGSQSGTLRSSRSITVTNTQQVPADPVTISLRVVVDGSYINGPAGHDQPNPEGRVVFLDLAVRNWVRSTVEAISVRAETNDPYVTGAPSDYLSTLAPADTDYAEPRLILAPDAPDGHEVEVAFQADYYVDGTWHMATTQGRFLIPNAH